MSFYDASEANHGAASLGPSSQTDPPAVQIRHRRLRSPREDRLSSPSSQDPWFWSSRLRQGPYWCEPADDASVPPYIPVTLERNSHRTGDFRECKTVRRRWRRYILCLFRAVARRATSRRVAIDPSASGTSVRDRAKVSQWFAQPRCPPPADRGITTLAAVAARRTASRVC